MNKYISYVLVLILLFAVACSKKPETVHEGKADVTVKLENNTEMFIITFHGAIFNENNSVAFKNFKGEMLLKDQNTVVERVPFQIDTILPFNTEKNIAVTKKYKESDAMPLLNLLRLTKDSAIKGQTNVAIPERNMQLNIINYDTVDIRELLKKAISEKKKSQNKTEGKNK